MTDALALAAVEPVRPGMLVGLGTGRAASRAIRALAERASRERLNLRCVSTSLASADLARSLGLAVLDFADVARVDYLFDGADEVDPALRMLKGRGGAMTREKIVARAAARRVYLIDDSKLVPRLGARFPVPVEILAFARSSVEARLRALGLAPSLRLSSPDDLRSPPARTDDGGLILDAAMTPVAEPEAVAAALDATAGVIGHGLFLSEAEEVIVEDAKGAVTRRSR